MRRILLGPQRLAPILDRAVARLPADGPIALVTAGWEENEADVDAVRTELGQGGPDLALYARSERLFEADAELLAADRERQERLRELVRLHRRRLNHALAAYRELGTVNGSSDLLTEERDAALEAVRELDRHHLSRVESIQADYERRARPQSRPGVAAEREELARLIDGSAVIAIAGGHVGVLLDLMRLFDLAPLITAKPLLAWSAGAMLLGERIVLFHDSPPWGAGNAESYDRGLGICAGLLPLPHARRRLRLHDPDRVALLARRFAPLVCAGMDEGALIECDEDGMSAESVQLLDRSGAVTRPAELTIAPAAAGDRTA